MSSSSSDAVGGGGCGGGADDDDDAHDGNFAPGPENDDIEGRPLIATDGGDDGAYGGITAPAEQQRGELADQAAGFLASKNIGWLMELEPDDVDAGKELPPLM
eukprot:SAG22_NODE_2035_length_3102_cov_3.066933_2_plen_103_part_00